MKITDEQLKRYEDAMADLVEAGTMGDGPEAMRQACEWAGIDWQDFVENLNGVVHTLL